MRTRALPGGSWLPPELAEALINAQEANYSTWSFDGRREDGLLGGRDLCEAVRYCDERIRRHAFLVLILNCIKPRPLDRFTFDNL
jgi:hypothetical protein